jgi:hypothetical protein
MVAMSSIQTATDEQTRQRQRVRRTTLVLTLIAAGFYIAFIVMSVSKALR